MTRNRIKTRKFATYLRLLYLCLFFLLAGRMITQAQGRTATPTPDVQKTERQTATAPTPIKSPSSSKASQPSGPVTTKVAPASKTFSIPLGCDVVTESNQTRWGSGGSYLTAYAKNTSGHALPAGLSVQWTINGSYVTRSLQPYTAVAGSGYASLDKPLAAGSKVAVGGVPLSGLNTAQVATSYSCVAAASP